jgi:hypothetical protein
MSVLQVKVITDSTFENEARYNAFLVTEQALLWFSNRFGIQTTICHIPGGWQEECRLTVTPFVSGLKECPQNLRGLQFFRYCHDLLYKGLGIYPCLTVPKEEYLIKQLSAESPEKRIVEAASFLVDEFLMTLTGQFHQQFPTLPRNMIIIGFTGKLFPLIDAFGEIVDAMAAPLLKCAIIGATNHETHAVLHEIAHLFGTKDLRKKPLPQGIMDNGDLETNSIDPINAKRILKNLYFGYRYGF